MAVFYVAASLSGAFSGLLAYGIQKLDGTAKLSGWQWIFLIEGLIPVFLALFIWKVLPDSPETASFLTQAERDFLVRRLAEETGSGHGKVTNQDKITKGHILAGLSDWKVWAAVVIFWGRCYHARPGRMSCVADTGFRQYLRRLRLHRNRTHR